MKNFEELVQTILYFDFTKLYVGYEVTASLIIMIVLLLPFVQLLKKFIIPSIQQFIETKFITSSTATIHDNLSKQLVQLSVLFYIIFCNEFLDHIADSNKLFLKIKGIALQIYIIIAISILIISIINVAAEIYRKKSPGCKMPIDLYLQIIQIVITVCASLSVISTILGLSISGLFASLGAVTAVLTFVFKDTLSALVASLQVTTQNIIIIGDWVSVPSKDIDGIVEKITISMVTIRNFDTTTTTVPTSIFLENPIKTWRPLHEKGGRRIKRSLSIDMDYVKICDSAFLNEVKKIPLMQHYSDLHPGLFDQKNEITNITLFRKYINLYLKEYQEIHKDGFSFLVRQLDSTTTGIPIELHLFTKDTKWAAHEEVQAAIFEHMIGSLPKFDLKPFQTLIPNGK